MCFYGEKRQHRPQEIARATDSFYDRGAIIPLFGEKHFLNDGGPSLTSIFQNNSSLASSALSPRRNSGAKRVTVTRLRLQMAKIS